MIDVALFLVRSGAGGDGSPNFRREKYIPKGGPDGGDGGNGGSVFITADEHETTLRDFAGKQLFEAQAGENGSKRQRHGSHAGDLEIAVPLGTLVWEITDPEQWKATGESPKTLLGEVLHPNDRLLVAQGGKGGRGNVHFKSSTNRTPLEFEKGGLPQEKWILLELKLLADVGFVGFPNAGKSTLLSVLTKARPKIADYPFTTLSPHLGVMEGGDRKENYRYVLADLPGLIEQASEGKGLGHQFLRHIERCRLLVYILADDPVVAMQDPAGIVQRLRTQWQTLRLELRDFNPELVERPFLIVINKQDLLQPEKEAELAQLFATDVPQAAPGQKEEILFTAAIKQQGVEALKSAIHESLSQLPLPERKEDSTLPVYQVTKREEAQLPRLAYRRPLK